MASVALRHAIAIQTLEHAYMHVARSGYSLHNAAALDLLMEAERLTKNYFKAWSHEEWNQQIETVFRLYPEAKG